MVSTGSFLTDALNACGGGTAALSRVSLPVDNQESPSFREGSVNFYLLVKSVTNSLEIWKPVSDYVGLYDVSNQGRVRSLDRIQKRVTAKRTHQTIRQRGHLLKAHPTRQRNPHPVVGLYRDDIRESVLVSNLVAQAFLGPPPDQAMRVYHYNGDVTDNHVENLFYDYKRGERIHTNHLILEQVQRIKKALLDDPVAEVATRHGVNYTTVYAISTEKSWGWVTVERNP